MKESLAYISAAVEGVASNGITILLIKLEGLYERVCSTDKDKSPSPLSLVVVWKVGGGGHVFEKTL